MRARKVRTDSRGQVEMLHRPVELEKDTLKNILFALNIHGGVRAWRNLVGNFRTAGSGFVQCGIGGKGASDITGHVCTSAWPIPLWIEVKRPKGGRESKEQEAFIEERLREGCAAGFARTIAEALAIVDDARRAAELRLKGAA